MGNKTVERPTGLKESRPAPEFRELNAKGNFGSAARDVLKTSNRIMGGSGTRIKGVDGDMSAHQTARPDNAASVPLPLGRTPADFQAKQIPNIGKFTAEGDQTAHDVRRRKKSASMIWHGSEQNKNRTI